MILKVLWTRFTCFHEKTAKNISIFMMRMFLFVFFIFHHEYYNAYCDNVLMHDIFHKAYLKQSHYLSATRHTNNCTIILNNGPHYGVLCICQSLRLRHLKQRNNISWPQNEGVRLQFVSWNSNNNLWRKFIFNFVWTILKF